MGFDWNAALQACLIAWVARGNDQDARSAVVFAQALLDDIRTIGDNKGGFDAIKRDTGYSMRSVPPYVALAYDWLYDHPAMTASLKQRIRERLLQWMAWYKKDGYHAHVAGNNYNAGYVFGVTLAAVAIAGEGDAGATELWKHVRDDVWGKDMAKALGAGGILDGGDWWEGWQYAPLSIAEYATTAVVAAKHGLPTDGVDKWLTATLLRAVHARSGARDTIAPLGDVEDKTPPSMPHDPLTFLGIMIGPAPDVVKSQAASEYNRLKLTVKNNFLYVALAQANKIKPAPVALDKWPTAYYAPGTRAFYARTTWAKEGVWMMTTCAATPHDDADHQAPMAGNLTVTRGVDEVIVDPSPYGSMSTLTTNAPTVESKHLPPNYHPSQAFVERDHALRVGVADHERGDRHALRLRRSVQVPEPRERRPGRAARHRRDPVGQEGQRLDRGDRSRRDPRCRVPAAPAVSLSRRVHPRRQRRAGEGRREHAGDPQGGGRRHARGAISSSPAIAGRAIAASATRRGSRSASTGSSSPAPRRRRSMSSTSRAGIP
jgi:hypothetical protein